MKKRIIERSQNGIKAGDVVVPKKQYFVPGISVHTRVEKVVLTISETGPNAGSQEEWLECQVGKDRTLFPPWKFQRIRCQ